MSGDKNNKVNFDVKSNLIKIIMSIHLFAKSFSTKHPNSKFTLSQILDDIIYVLQTGIPWRKVRSKISHQTLWFHFNRFVKNNVFLKLYNLFRRQYITSSIMVEEQATLLIDSSIIYNKFGINKLGRNKFYKNKKCTKLSLLTDVNGIPLSIFLFKGNYHDNHVFQKHIKEALVLLPKNKLTILGDKGYSSYQNYQFLDSLKIAHIIPPRKKTKIYDTYKYIKTEYVKRIKIENVFAHLKLMRRIESRYDKFLSSYKQFLYLGICFLINQTVVRIQVRSNQGKYSDL